MEWWQHTHLAAATTALDVALLATPASVVPPAKVPDCIMHMQETRGNQPATLERAPCDGYLLRWRGWRRDTWWYKRNHSDSWRRTCRLQRSVALVPVLLLASCTEPSTTS